VEFLILGGSGSGERAGTSVAGEHERRAIVRGLRDCEARSGVIGPVLRNVGASRDRRAVRCRNGAGLHPHLPGGGCRGQCRRMQRAGVGAARSEEIDNFDRG
jgi:hypothetical protein